MNNKLILLLLLVSLMGKAYGEKGFMSVLDSAYSDALKNEGAQSSFYNAFLNAEIFIPTHDVPESDQRKRAGDDESISPIFVASEGIQYLMLFDSQERLGAWAQKEVGFVALPGHAIVEMMSADTHWALNVGTEYMKTFVPDEIKWLKESLAGMKGQQVEVPKNTKVLIGVPATIPIGLVTSLSEVLIKNTEIKSAYLGQVYYEAQGEKPHLVLVLDLDEHPQVTVDAIRKSLVVAIQGLLGETEFIDIMIKHESELATEVTKVVDAFYNSKE